MRTGSLLLPLLYGRVCVPGVLQKHQIGVTVHALRQLDLLNVSDNRLLGVISATVRDGDARTLANVLHGLALSTREQRDPHIALPLSLQRTLNGVQGHALDCVDDMTAAESVLATEAILKLLPYGHYIINTRLWEELRERAKALVVVVERPVELLAILRVMMEAHQSPIASAAHSTNKNSAIIVVSQQWCEEALSEVLSAIAEKLDTWRKQELITLIDALTLRVNVPTAASSTKSPLSSRKLLNVCRPLVAKVLDQTLSLVATNELSPSQACAWITRLVELQLYGSHPLFMRIVFQVEPQSLSYAQLLSAVNAIQAVLHDEDFSVKLKVSDSATLISKYVQLLRELVNRLDQKNETQPDGIEKFGGSLNGHSVLLSVREMLAPLLLALPEAALISVYASYTAHHRPDTRQSLALFSEAVEKGFSVTLRNYKALLPSEFASVVVAALCWRVYIPPVSNSVNYNDDKLLTSWRAAPHRGHLLWVAPALSTEAAERKLHALCGLVRQQAPFLPVSSMMDILNEAAACCSGDRQQHYVPQRTRGLLTLRSLCSHLHSILQQEAHNQELRQLTTQQLVRYLTTMSAMDVRSATSYVAVLSFLQDRDLSVLELTLLLTVIAKHHVAAPYFVRQCVQRLPDIATSLSASQKALFLKNLGQTHVQRIVRAPLFPPLDGGHFLQEAEVSDLSYLDAIFSFNGLMNLRQYENVTLKWLLDGQRGPLSTAPEHLADSGIQSASTLATFCVNLCRLGGPREGVPIALVTASMESLRRRLVVSKGVFTDVTQLMTGWPLLVEYPSLVLASCNGKTDKAAIDSSLRSEWEQTVRCASTLVRDKLVNIAADTRLRPNTFLVNQLSAGVLLGAMPLPGSDVEQRLIDHMDLGKIVIAYSSRQLIDNTVVGLYLAERHPHVAEALLNAVRHYALDMKAQEALTVWWHLDCALAPSKHWKSSEALLSLVRDIREVVKTKLTEEKTISRKLSPMELQLRSTLL